MSAFESLVCLGRLITLVLSVNVICIVLRSRTRMYNTTEVRKTRRSEDMRRVTGEETIYMFIVVLNHTRARCSNYIRLQTLCSRGSQDLVPVLHVARVQRLQHGLHPYL